jgi:hypothetical protein
MVCIAAFIILALIGGVVAVISIFKPHVGKSYWKMFKKAWGCLWKKVRLQKCETGFKDDVKNTILSRVIVKHPKWVKPLSAIIEVLSVIVVIIAVWALLTAIKSLLALWALGSCNVTKPSACSLGAEMCSIDQQEPTNVFEATGRWFEEWGEIFEAIPDKFRTYNPDDYDFNYIDVTTNADADASVVIDIFDPGCSACRDSYRNQKDAGFFDKYNVRLVPFAIQDADNNYKFKNSELIVRYMLAAEQIRSGISLQILDRVYTWDYTFKDGSSDPYQNLFNNYSREDAINKLVEWLKDLGLKNSAINEIQKIADYPEITDKMNQNRDIIENQLKVRGIPTMIIDGKRHTGTWKSEN